MERRSENALVFMVKWPEPGRAKTRLSPPLSPGQAAGLARSFLLDTLAGAAAADAERWLAFAPAAAGPKFAALVGPGIGLIEAAATDLGTALSRAQRAAFRHGYGRVALVASDLPHLPARCYADGFAALDGADVALGPSGDGGYYLLASRLPTPDLFRGVAWSTSAVYEQTLRRAAHVGFSVSAIAGCDDVDAAADLVWLLDRLRAGPGAGHTLAALERCAPLIDGLAAD
jgi:rSAM/selenodomain-associated transferase 1